MTKYSIAFLALLISGSAGVLSAQITVVVHPAHIPVTFTGSVQFSATVNGSTNGVQWAVDNIPGGNSAVGKISTSGLYLPPAKVGIHTVTAEVSGSSVKGNAKVYVTNYAGVFTYQNDNQRTGQNLSEIALTPASVNHVTFGKLFSFPLDGYVRNQPLYMANVLIPGQGYHNLVFVATEHNSVFAFDADGRQTTPIWQVSFNDPATGITTIPSSAFASFCNYCSLEPEFGITATPVIDPSTETIYVAARTQQVAGGVTTYMQQLHALDVTTGEEKFGGPIAIQASASGTGPGSVDGVISFDPFWQMIRTALLFSNGTVYMGSASLGDAGPYHGWILGYSPATGTLEQTGVFITTPNGSRGGVWEDGAGLSADTEGNIFFATGNGTFDVNTGGLDYGVSEIELTPNSVTGALTVAGYFTPYDQAKLNKYDWDLSSAGVTILPDQSSGPYPHLAIAGGKEGTVYVLNRDSMGGYNASSNSQIPQELVGAIRGSVPGEPICGFWNEPAYWNGYVYIFGMEDVLKVFQLTDGQLSTSPISEGTLQMRAPVPVVSANGTTNAVIWALEWDHSTLRAYTYDNLASEIYGTNQVPSRDHTDGTTAKTSPTVANGRVYVATETNLDVYGLLP